jgi:hypothetical protein
MTARLLSIVQAGAERSRGGDESRREQLLLQKLLAFPTARRGDSRSADKRLVPVASVLLKSQLTLAEAFGWESCLSPLQPLLLLVYVRQGRGSEISLRSLCHTPVLGPGSVALRWTAKLLADGVLELTGASEPDDRLLRLSSEAVSTLERRLRDINSEFEDCNDPGFSV